MLNNLPAALVKALSSKSNQIIIFENNNFKALVNQTRTSIKFFLQNCHVLRKTGQTSNLSNQRSP